MSVKTLPTGSISKDNSLISDMELIDLLWEQDMDMGIGRELFDPQYRLQLEKESYLNQQKQLEKEKAQAQKEAELYTIDAETGERIYSQPPGSDPLGCALEELHDMFNMDQQPQIKQEFNTATFHHDMPSPQTDTQAIPDDLAQCLNADGLWAPQFNSNLDIGLKQEEDMDYHDWRDLRDISYEEFDHLWTNYGDQPKEMAQPQIFSSLPLEFAAAEQPWTANSPSSGYRSAPESVMSPGSSVMDMSKPDKGAIFMEPSTPSQSARSRGIRDQKKIKELGIPLTTDQIIDSQVEEFNELLKCHDLTETQLHTIRDIRRRGKNKVAAQNCRKKKLSEVTELGTEISALRAKRDALLRDKVEIERSHADLRNQLNQTYTEVFMSLHDANGRPYDPISYTMNICVDGTVQVIPKSVFNIPINLSLPSANQM